MAVDSALSCSPLPFVSAHAVAIFPLPPLKLAKPTSITSSIPSLSESKSNKSATPSRSKSHNVCEIKMSSKAKSLPPPPGALFLKRMVKALIFPKLTLVVNCFQTPCAQLLSVVLPEHLPISPVLNDVRKLFDKS